MTVRSEIILSNLGGIEHNNLVNILDMDTNELLEMPPSLYYEIDELKKLSNTTGTNKHFSILSMNIQSIHSKFHELEVFIETLHNIDFKFNIICLQECWLSDQTDSISIQLPGYDCIVQGRSISASGGLVTFVDKLFQHEIVLNVNMHTLWEGLILQIKGGVLPKALIIGNIYRPPRMLKEEIKQFINEFELLILSLEKYKLNINLAGDYNLNLLKINNDELCNEFFDLITSHSLLPRITLPTRISNASGTLIDNILCKADFTIKPTTAGILLNKLSDHQPCFVLVDTTFARSHNPKFIRKYVQIEDVITNINNDICSSEIYNKIDKRLTADPNVNYNIMHDIIEETKNTHMTSKLVKFNKYKHKKSKWITRGLLRSIRFRDNLYKKIKLTNPGSREYEILSINLKTFNRILRRSISTAKQQFLASTFDKYKSDIKNTWKTINETLCKKGNKSTSPTSLNINGIAITNKLDIANAFNNYFTNIGDELAKGINYSGTKGFTHYLRNRHNNKFSLNEVNEQSVIKIIENLPLKSSCGFDDMSSKFIKQITPSIITPLTLVINQIFNTGIFPDKLKIAKVVPIFKKGDNTLMNNYRPISLLPVISKVIEKIICTQLSSYFENNKLFYDSQYGFRPNHCTEQATLELTDRIISAMDNNDVPIGVFLDLSKAFDTIDHNILLNKLEHYGIEGIPLQLFKNYLTNRKQYVKLCDIKSNVLQIKTGVPQGSILGPLLFIIYINDFSRASAIFDFICYADDTTLFCTLSKLVNAQNTNPDLTINIELAKINEWLEINKLSLN